MKKLLLSVALTALAAGASAQSFGDFFKVTYDGKEYQPGETIVVPTNAGEANLDDPELTDYIFSILVTNLDAAPRTIEVDYRYLNPAAAEDGYGLPQLCYTQAYNVDGNSFLSPFGCLATMPCNIKLGVNEESKEPLSLDIHQEECEPSKVSTFKLTLTPLDDLPDPNAGWKYVEEVCAPAVFTIQIGGEDSGVAQVTIDPNAPKTYYDLQGRKVENPAPGLYIVKQGEKTVKVLVR